VTPAFSRFLLKITGWEVIGGAAPEKNCIMLEAPHTSIWDFLVGYIYYRSVGGYLRTMIKKEAFVFPLKYILRAMGAFPIDRKNPQATIRSIINEMESAEGKTFHLVICPEGTRRAVHKWKTGYHLIATEVGIPVYITFVDWGHKKVGISGKVELTGTPREDTDKIQKIYEDLGVIGKYPENFATR